MPTLVYKYNYAFSHSNKLHRKWLFDYTATCRELCKIVKRMKYDCHYTFLS